MNKPVVSFFVCLAVVCGYFGCSVASASTVYASSAAAAAACNADLAYKKSVSTGWTKCTLVNSASPSQPDPFPNAGCPAGRGITYYQYVEGYNQFIDYGYQYTPCYPLKCAGSFAATYSYSPASTADYHYGSSDFDGCCITFAESRRQTVTFPDRPGLTFVSVDGTAARTGSRCYIDMANGNQPPAPPAAKVCDSVSCYSPGSGTACYGTQSGEQVCKQVDDAGGHGGGCAAGATGAVCSGSPPPAPSDPPIPPGAQPNAVLKVTDSAPPSGGGPANLIVNQYSGTSPGPGPTNPPVAGGGYSGTNAGGTGNAPGGPAPGGTAPVPPGSNGVCQNGEVPTASGCSGTYRDSGCDTPPACFGDAVLCGIAVNTHNTNCSVLKGVAASGSSVGPVPSMGDPMDASGDPSSSAVSSSVDLGAASSSLDASGFGFSSTCPLDTPISFSLMGKDISVDTSRICSPLSYIYFLVLGFAYFLSVKIIAGVR